MNFFKYILVLFLLLIVGQANSLFYPAPYFLLVAISVIIFTAALFSNQLLKRNLFIPLAILLIFHLTHALFFGRFNILLVVSMIFTLSLITVLKGKFISYFISNMYWLTLISLVLYIPTFFALSDFATVLSSLQETLYLTNVQGDGLYSANIIVYTINATDFARNCGFMWEPGPFSSLLSLAVFFELIRNNFKINRTIIIFTIAILTTFSTTGYLCLLALFFFFYSNRYSTKIISQVFFMIIMLGISVSTFQLDFMGQKIQDTLQTDTKEYNTNIRWIKQQGTAQSYSLGRVQGLMLNYEDFKTSPVFGIGSADNSKITKSFGSLQSMNGLGNVMAKYGILGLILLAVGLFKTSMWIKTKFNVKAAFTIAVLFLIQTFAFTFIFSPFYLLILLLFLIGDDGKSLSRVTLENQPAINQYSNLPEITR